MAQIAHAVFAQAAPEPASWEGARALSAADAALPSQLTRRAPRRRAAGADALLRQLLHVFNEKTLQRALTIVDQVRGGAAPPVCRQL